MTEPAPIRLLIVDDHPVVRDGLHGMFTGDPRFEVLGEAANGAEAVTLAEALRPDVVLMDLRMPAVDGVTAITRLRERGVPARVSRSGLHATDRAAAATGSRVIWLRALTRGGSEITSFLRSLVPVIGGYWRDISPR